MQIPLKIGLIGNGHQMRETHLPYIHGLMKTGSVEISWLVGCLCSPIDKHRCTLRHYKSDLDCQVEQAPSEETYLSWEHHLLTTEPVDCVIISVPNFLHGRYIRIALEQGIHVAVDKPTTITSRECAELVSLAERKGLVFVTLSQRRYENVYQQVKTIIQQGGLGKIRLINYLFTHEFGAEPWRLHKSIAGGGVLIESGYHGIDTILWLMKQFPGDKIFMKSVSARWIPVNSDDPQETVESIIAVRIMLSNGGIFNLTTSYENPRGSLDENIKIFGTNGAVRITRDRSVRTGTSAASLSYQNKEGVFTEFDTKTWVGKRWAPLDDFMNAVLSWKAGDQWSVQSAAKESIDTLKIIEQAYRSAESDGKEIDIYDQVELESIHHVAVQTNEIDSAVAFYVDILGAELLERRQFKKRQMAWMRIGEVKLELFSKREGDELEPWSKLYCGPVHIAFKVKDLDLFLDAALEKGAKFHPSHPEPFVPQVEGAKKIAYLLGPDGEEIEIRSS